MTTDAAIATVLLRLVPDVDAPLRDRLRKRGDLAKLLETILNEVDLGAVAVSPVSFSSEAAKTTTVKLPCDEYERIKKSAADRGVSVNALLNGAIGFYLEQNPKPRGRSKSYKAQSNT